MSLFSLISMYALIYAGAERSGDAFRDMSGFSMALFMAAPMAAIDVALGLKKVNHAARMGVIIVLIGALLLIRHQVMIAGSKLLEHMMPYQAATLCGQAKVKEKKQCRETVSLVTSARFRQDVSSKRHPSAGYRR